MLLNIPPLQWPKIYNMVNLGGIDLATANGSVVPGIYQKITTALTSDHIEVFYNWKFADIVLPPSKVVIDVSVANQYTINEEILVKSDDTVGIIGFIRIPIIIPLTAEENAVYDIPTGADGFGPVTVQVPIPTPTLVSLNVTENGSYTPGTGEDGFSDVTVAVPDPPPPVLVTLNATANGDYTPASDEDGFSSVSVAVPPVKVLDNFCVNWDFTNPINTNGQSTYSGRVYAIDGWAVYDATMKLVTGGITVEKTGSSWGGFYQRTKPALINYFSGKQMTVSAIVDGSLITGTFTFPTSSGGTAAYGIPGCTIRIYRQPSGIAELTIDAAPTGSPHVISAYKFEFGSTQTLATKVNGIWVVNQNMIVNAEKLKQYILLN